MNPLRILWVGLLGGLAFAILDALINANPIAQRLYAAFRPIMRPSVNAPLGIAFDLIFGIAMAAIFTVLIPALPPHCLTRALVFGFIAWFFRVVMGAASQIVMFQIPLVTTVYTVTAGLAEMLLLALLYSLLLKPR